MTLNLKIFNKIHRVFKNLKYICIVLIDQSRMIGIIKKMVNFIFIFELYIITLDCKIMK